MLIRIPDDDNDDEQFNQAEAVIPPWFAGRYHGLSVPAV
jgi:hypothetical protein